MNSKKSNRIQPILIVIMLIVCAVFIVMTVWETNINREQQLEAYRKVLDTDGQMMVRLAETEYKEAGDDENAMRMCNQLVHVISDGFVTSASQFCYVALDEDLVFLRDDKNHSEIRDMTREGFLRKYEQDFLVQEQQIYIGNHTCYLGVVAGKEYVINQMGLSTLQMHLSVYMIVIAAICVALVILMQAKLIHLDNTRIFMEQQIQNYREAIDELQKTNPTHTFENPTDHNYGIVCQKLVEDVQRQMSKEQMDKSLWMNIQCRKTTDMIHMAALLERGMNKKYIGYYVKPDGFRLLLMNTTNEEAMRFVQFLSERMEREYQAGEKSIEIGFETVEEK